MDSRRRFRIICLTLFTIYVIAIIYFLLFSDTFGRTEKYQEPMINPIPFVEIHRFLRSALYGGSIKPIDIAINLLGNIVAFIPFGALVRWARNKKTSFFTAVLYTFFFSLTIETIQYFTKVGVFDVDDLILNTMGGAIGYAIYRILRAIDRKRYENDKKDTQTI